jgi:hypothetical protein
MMTDSPLVAQFFDFSCCQFHPVAYETSKQKRVKPTGQHSG